MNSEKMQMVFFSMTNNSHCIRKCDRQTTKTMKKTLHLHTNLMFACFKTYTEDEMCKLTLGPRNSEQLFRTEHFLNGIFHVFVPQAIDYRIEKWGKDSKH